MLLTRILTAAAMVILPCIQLSGQTILSAKSAITYFQSFNQLHIYYYPPSDHLTTYWYCHETIKPATGAPYSVKRSFNK